MMTTMSNLPNDLAEEIFSRVPLTSLCAVRSTCKKWDALSKNRIFGKSAAGTGRKQFLGFMIKDSRVCSLRFDLQGIRNEGDFVGPSIKQVSILDQVEISQIFHCNGLLLCITKDNSRLLVWNPYLSQTRWIRPRDEFHILDRYAIGYDKNRNHKILRIFGDYESINPNPNLIFGYEIYDLSSNSWKVFNISPDEYILYYRRGVSLMGNTYFLAEENEDHTRTGTRYIISFDFTTERFGQRMPLPENSHEEYKFVSLCCIREEQLAVLLRSWMNGPTLEIWVTNKIDPAGAVSWSKFLRGIYGRYGINHYLGASFFIDEEKKVAVVVDLDNDIDTPCKQKANIIGQDGYFKSVNMGEALRIIDKRGYMAFCRSLVCSSSYVPSTVKLQPGISKENDD